MATHTAMAQGSDASVRSSFEQRVGIIYHVSQKEHGWHGQTRTRFTDFQVHEISKNGEVVHLHDFPMSLRDLTKREAPNQPAARPQISQSSQPKETNPTAGSVSAATLENQESQPSTNSEQPSDGRNYTTISASDRAVLTDLLGRDTADSLISLHSKINEDKQAQPKTDRSVKIAAIADKAQRSRVHSEIRRVFGGKLDTATDADGSINATIVGKGNRQWGNRLRHDRSRNSGQNAGQEREGNFVHFTLYKENRDTMDAIGQIARCLNLKPAFFGIAGTKDRRAVTTQRVSIRRNNLNSLISINRDKVYGVKIGDFKFEKHPIHLGHHSGNEFVIVLKNCHFSGTGDLTFEQKLDVANSTVCSAVEQVKQNGFINYYGTQRFGTHQIGTQEVGVKILKQDFEGAVRALLSFDPSLLDISDPSSADSTRREDIYRARACSTFLDTGDAQAATKYLPRRCHVESALMRHLGRQPKDFLGALLSINRGMRTMYVHAYQSLVWNFAASKRWELFGLRVVKGDLVLLDSETPTSGQDRHNGNDDEETIHLVDGGADIDDMQGLKAHALTEEEASSGKYSIFDVVLPSPGWDVAYPDNEIAQFYKEFMAREENGGLDPQDMRRRQKDFSLPGSYRKLMGKFIGSPSASVQVYSKDTEQLVPTDLDLIRTRKANEAAERAATQRETREQLSTWQNAAKDVQESDRQGAQTNAGRRKAEECSDEPEVRVKDTWVQTSVDGSNKRVKVSVQTDDPNSESKISIPQVHRGEMQVDGDEAHQPNMAEGIQAAGQDAGDSSPLTATTLTTQVRYIAKSALQLLMSALRVFTNNDNLKPPENATLSEEQPCRSSNGNGVEEAPNDNVNHISSEPEPYDGIQHGGQAANILEQSSDATISGNASVQTPQLPPLATADEKKIAVILRFALNTSQYATIVLRELQGVVPMSDKPVSLTT